MTRQRVLRATGAATYHGCWDGGPQCFDAQQPRRCCDGLWWCCCEPLLRGRRSCYIGSVAMSDTGDDACWGFERCPLSWRLSGDAATAVAGRRSCHEQCCDGRRCWEVVWQGRRGAACRCCAGFASTAAGTLRRKPSCFNGATTTQVLRRSTASANAATNRRGVALSHCCEAAGVATTVALLRALLRGRQSLLLWTALLRGRRSCFDERCCCEPLLQGRRSCYVSRRLFARSGAASGWADHGARQEAGR